MIVYFGAIPGSTQDEEGHLVPVQKRMEERWDWTPGGGGLFFDGDDMRFGLMMRDRGTIDGVRVLEPETVAETSRPAPGVAMSLALAGLGA